MKIRYGWVSNSSSSSFLIAWKPVKPLGDLLSDALAVQKTHPLHGFIDSIVEEMLRTDSKEIGTLEELHDYRVKNYYEEPGESEVDVEKRLIEEGYRLKIGDWASDGDTSIERWLAENDLHFSAPNIQVFHDGSY
jgi:hypothetical protein